MKRPIRSLAAAAVIAVAALPALAPAVHAAQPPDAKADGTSTIRVVVREQPGAGEAPERAVAALGGRVERQLTTLGGFTAQLPPGSVAALTGSRGVQAVTPDRAVTLSGSYDGFDPSNDYGSMYHITNEVTGAGEFWARGVDGRGVGVALLDSGVVPVDGLRTPGKVVLGPDLSLESQAPDRRNLDTFGHGTHMAGIIAGRDDATPVPAQKGVTTSFMGMAPGAHLVSLKLADAHGATDVSQVLAAIDWVVAHKDDPGMNIKVLNLSFGTDGVQDYRLDPLSYAAEVAWRKGIVVVVAGGNQGNTAGKLNAPAYNPRLLAVGGADGRGTFSVDDDVIGTFSSHGDSARAPDLVAPGKSIVSLRAPGSSIDLANPQALVGIRQLKGSGTSQAAAVVSGAAALIVQQRPGITPDQVKALLTSTARRLPAADTRAQGAGMIDLKAALVAATPASSVQPFAPALGTGTLDASRGLGRLTENGVPLAGEQDIFGAPFDSTTWAARAAAGTAWDGQSWNGNRWAGDVWTGNRWAGNRWAGDVWTGNRWAGNRWAAEGWLGNRWAGNRWAGDDWSFGSWG